MKKSDIKRLEGLVIKYALQRLKEWKREYPDGLLPKDHPSATRSKPGRKMIEACLELEDAMKRSK